MATVAYDSGLQWDQTTVSAQTNRSGTGAAAEKEVRASSDRAPLKLVTGTLTFDSSYPTNGEDISNIWKQFTPTARDNNRVATAWDLRGILVTTAPLGAKLVDIDHTNKKALVYTALGAEAGNASNQSTVVVRFIAWGT